MDKEMHINVALILALEALEQWKQQLKRQDMEYNKDDNSIVMSRISDAIAAITKFKSPY